VVTVVVGSTVGPTTDDVPSTVTGAGTVGETTGPGIRRLGVTVDDVTDDGGGGG
jgi:hypothetical protein